MNVILLAMSTLPKTIDSIRMLSRLRFAAIYI